MKISLSSAALAAALLLLLVSCATSVPASRTPLSDILGVTLGMPGDTVRTTLAATGKFERQERKRQEIWTVRDPRFSSLIIGYDENRNVRFVTAVADPAGVPVTYGDVVDIAAAEHREAGENHTYTWRTGDPRYFIIAIGGPERVNYLSLKKDNTAD